MTVRNVLLAVFAGALVGACGPEIPNHQHAPHPDPEPPPEKPIAKIAAFTASPATLKKGETAKLSWVASDATSISLRERNGTPVPGVDAAALAGEVSVAPTATTTYILQATGTGGSDFAIAQVAVADEALEIPEAPLLLAAMPDTIDAGDKAVLVFSGPEKVVITADGSALDTGEAKSGSVEVKPVVTTTYTAASGKQQVTAEVKVRPSVNQFFSTPAGAAPGQKVRLTWTSVGATEIKLSERQRGELYTARPTELNEGSFEDTIPANLPHGAILQYALTVRNAAGIKTRNVQVIVSTVPTITEFKTQTALTAGGSVKPKLEWKTTSASRVRILSGRTGTTPSELQYVAPGTEVAAGSLELPLPSESTDYELIADSEQGGQTSKRITLKIVAQPVVTDFKAVPATISNPGDGTRLEWKTTGGSSMFVGPAGSSSVYWTTTPADIASGFTTITAAATREFELVIFNEAGDRVTARTTLNVTNPTGFTFNPKMATPGQQVTMTWDFPNAVAVYGAPIGETRRGQEPFIDIATSPGAKELKTITGQTVGAAETLVFPDGFKFSHFGIVYDRALITNRGWIGFDETYPAIQSTIVPEASPGTPNNLICGWCSENLTGGKIFWEMKGLHPNRQLIVQWEKWRGTSTTSSLTFEIVLHESGQVDLLYKEMTAVSQTVNTKLENKDGSFGYNTAFTAPPAAGDAITFNGAGPKMGSVDLKFGASANYELYVDTGMAKFPVRASLPVISSGSLAVTEIMYKPVSGAAAGQWIEIENRSGTPLDASHFSIKTAAGTVTLPAFTIPADAYVVVGQSKDLALNGGTPVDIELPTMMLGATTDTVEVRLGTSVLSTITYDDAAITVPAGVSISPNSGLGPKFCQADTTYGTAGSKGSPGTKGKSCGGYTRMPIAANFRDIRNTGVSVIKGTSSYGSRELITFPSGFKFPFDGADRTSCLMGNGYITFDPTATPTTGTSGDPNRDNPTTFPDPSIPGGIIAVFWDTYGVYDGGTAEKSFQYFDPDNNPATKNGYLILSWKDYDFLGNSGQIDVQIWLYENGDIDFQWGTITPGSLAADVVNGSRATIGIMNMAKTQAIIVGHNQPVITPNSGLRFRAD